MWDDRGTSGRLSQRHRNALGRGSLESGIERTQEEVDYTLAALEVLLAVPAQLDQRSLGPTYIARLEPAARPGAAHKTLEPPDDCPIRAARPKLVKQHLTDPLPEH